MTNRVMDILIGSLLGDGYLVKSSPRSKNAMFKLKQCSRFSSYVEYMYGCLGKYVKCDVRSYRSKKPSRVNGKISHDEAHWNGEYCESRYFWSRCDPVFTDLWNNWYSGGKKSVPENISLNTRSLSHWFVEDGSNNITSKSKGVALYTQSFSEADCNLLVDVLSRDLDLEAKVYSGPVIRIMSGSYFKFMKMVSPYVKIFGCFDYKIDTEGAPSDRKGESWKGPKLNYEKAEEIRELRKDGAKLKDIAKQYGVTVSTVGKIANHQMYIHKSDANVVMGGAAKVKLVIEYGD